MMAFVGNEISNFPLRSSYFNLLIKTNSIVKKIRTNRKIVTNPNAVSSMEDGSTIGTRIPVVSAVRSQQAWGEIMDREHEMEQRTISDSNNNLTSNSIRRSLINVMRNAVGGYGTVTGETQGRFHPMMMTAASITGESSSGSNEEIFNSFVMQLANNNTSGFQTLVDGTTGRLGFPPALPSTRNNINNLSSTRNNTNHNNSSIRRSTQEIDRIGNSPLRHKIVYQLRCKFCLRHACNRAMRAILLADTKVELYSTDIPPAKTINLSEEDRMTQGCNCRIRDTACTGCGNVLGYHVSQPCDRCLEAKNNGHFWMFYSETIHSYERPDPLSVDGKPLYWGSLSPMRETHLITSADGQSSSHAFISTGDIDGILFAGSEASASAMHCLIRYETYCR